MTTEHLEPVGEPRRRPSRLVVVAVALLLAVVGAVVWVSRDEPSTAALEEGTCPRPVAPAGGAVNIDLRGGTGQEPTTAVLNPDVVAATGPLLENNFLTLRYPDRAHVSGGTAVGRTSHGICSEPDNLTISFARFRLRRHFPLDRVAEASSGSNRWAVPPKRMPDVTIDGRLAFHLRGEMYLGPGDEYGALIGRSVVLFTFEFVEPDEDPEPWPVFAQRRQLTIDSVLTTVRWQRD